MIEGDAHTGPTAFSVGDQLRAAREAQGLDLGEIAARTRIPQRHLAAIESGNYSGLPSTTYATGFARAYARAVGLDDVAVVDQVRGELAHRWNRPTPVAYEPDDPARTPSSGLVWAGVLVAVLVLIAAGLWFGTNWFRGGTAPASVALPSGDVATAAIATRPPPATAGQVTLTANDDVWVRVYDAAGTTLMMKTMAAGERYDVPPGADRPMINVGRPDKLSVTVNGSVVAPLGDGRVAIKDVPIDADALLARGAPSVAPAPAPTTAPAAASTPTPTPASSPRARPSPRASETPRTAPTTPAAVPTATPAPPTPAATPTAAPTT